MAQALLASWVVETSSGLPLITLRLRQGVFSQVSGSEEKLTIVVTRLKKHRAKAAQMAFDEHSFHAAHLCSCLIAHSADNMRALPSKRGWALAEVTMCRQ